MPEAGSVRAPMRAWVQNQIARAIAAMIKRKNRPRQLRGSSVLVIGSIPAFQIGAYTLAVKRFAIPPRPSHAPFASRACRFPDRAAFQCARIGRAVAAKEPADRTSRAGQDILPAVLQGACAERSSARPSFRQEPPSLRTSGPRLRLVRAICPQP